jgi:hypothetical protein
LDCNRAGGAATVNIPVSAARRPLSVTLVGWLFVLVGGGGIVMQLAQLLNSGPLDDRGLRDLAIVSTLRLIALVAGAMILRGADWARWLLAVWMAYHVWISLQHSWTEAAMHAVIFGALLYVLLRRNAAAYFRQAG